MSIQEYPRDDNLHEKLDLFKQYSDPKDQDKLMEELGKIGPVKNPESEPNLGRQSTFVDGKEYMLGGGRKRRSVKPSKSKPKKSRSRSRSRSRKSKNKSKK
jgi:hypothetical protein